MDSYIIYMILLLTLFLILTSCTSTIDEQGFSFNKSIVTIENRSLQTITCKSNIELWEVKSKQKYVLYLEPNYWFHINAKEGIVVRLVGDQHDGRYNIRLEKSVRYHFIIKDIDKKVS